MHAWMNTEKGRWIDERMTG